LRNGSAMTQPTHAMPFGFHVIQLVFTTRGYQKRHELHVLLHICAAKTAYCNGRSKKMSKSRWATSRSNFSDFAIGSGLVHFGRIARRQKNRDDFEAR
jgi:hypothetical protein